MIFGVHLDNKPWSNLPYIPEKPILISNPNNMNPKLVKIKLKFHI